MRKTDGILAVSLLFGVTVDVRWGQGEPGEGGKAVAGETKVALHTLRNGGPATSLDSASQGVAHADRICLGPMTSAAAESFRALPSPRVLAHALPGRVACGSSARTRRPDTDVALPLHWRREGGS